jgi:F420-dependent oxidoreductase-like protein
VASIPFGLGVPQGWRMDLVEIADPVEKYEAMTRVAQEADKLNFDSLWLFDHFHTVPVPTQETTFECFTSLAGLARDTQHIKLGQMATCNGYRNPALLAKMGSTIDVMSHGRFILGLGAGWYYHEYNAYGYDFPETKERMARFREACQIVHRMWTEDAPEFEGKYYAIHKPINEPKGVQQPHPPLWIAGGGEQVTLKLVAQWGDGCNLGGTDLELVRHKLDILRGHCDAAGRDFASITRSFSANVHLLDDAANAEAETAAARGQVSYADYARTRFVGTPQQIAERLHTLTKMGINYFIMYLPRVAYDLSQLQWFARDIVPQFQ